MAGEPTTIEEFIAQLQDWYATNHDDFKTLFDKAVAGVQPIPPGQPESVCKDWSKATIDDLCSFFKEWYYWMPLVATGLEYIQKFSWLYYENPDGLTFVTKGSGQTVSPGYTMTAEFVTLRGAFMDSEKDSHFLVQQWVEELGTKQMSQFKRTEAKDYTSFNDFFIREVKDGARPVSDKDDETVIVAPADCVINMIVDDLTAETQIQVKTVTLNVSQLLDGSPHADKFIGGTAVSCILMPNTYHRYHSPVSGKVIESNDSVVGDYFGIKDFPDLLHKGDVGYGYDYKVFETFRRGYLVMQTANYGLVGMVPVGLNTIASVVFHSDKFGDKLARITPADPPVDIVKGDEVGYFKYGGSLNILLFEPGRFPSMTLLQGQRIGAFSPNATVQSNQAWQDSGITLQPANTASVRYTGGLWTANPATGMVNADGNDSFVAKPGYTLPGAFEGLLCGKIGESGAPFPIGNNATIPSGQSGNLFLCINDDLNGEYGPGLTDNVGAVNVIIEIDP